MYKLVNFLIMAIAWIPLVGVIIAIIATYANNSTIMVLFGISIVKHPLLYMLVQLLGTALIGNYILGLFGY